MPREQPKKWQTDQKKRKKEEKALVVKMNRKTVNHLCTSAKVAATPSQARSWVFKGEVMTRGCVTEREERRNTLLVSEAYYLMRREAAPVPSAEERPSLPHFTSVLLSKETEDGSRLHLTEHLHLLAATTGWLPFPGFGKNQQKPAGSIGWP